MAKQTPQTPQVQQKNGTADTAADRITPYQIVEQYPAHKLKETTVRAALANNAIFKRAGVIEERKIEGTKYPPVRWVRRDAVEEWLKSLGGNGGGTKTRNRAGGKRYMIRVLADKHDAVVAALAPFGITLEVAYKGSKKDATATAATADTAAPVQDTAAADMFAEGGTVKS